MEKVDSGYAVGIAPTLDSKPLMSNWEPHTYLVGMSYQSNRFAVDKGYNNLVRTRIRFAATGSLLSSWWEMGTRVRLFLS